VGAREEHKNGANHERHIKPTRVFCRWFNKKQKNKLNRVHQLVAHEWVGNPAEKRCVDHIDGNRANNHWENLRYATHAENSRNMKKHIDGSSIYKGVSWDKRATKWRAQIIISRKVVNLGRFTNEREAAESYNEAASENFGEFARLNEFDA
jgi:hypothetical protein